MNFKATLPPPKSNVTSVTSTYSILPSDFLVLVDGTSGNFTVTLPTAVGRRGQTFRVKRTDNTLVNIVTLATTGGQTIDGVSTRSLATIAEQIDVVSDGTNWQVANRYFNQTSFAYTPVYVGFGTVTVSQATWRRVGDSINVQGRFTPGTTTAVVARINLPSGLSTDIGKIPATNICGLMQYNGNPQTWVLAASGSNGYVTVWLLNVTATAGFTNQNGNAIASAGTELTFNFTVPVTNWEG